MECSPDFVHVKAIAVFFARVQYLAETLLSKIRRGKTSNISFTFPESWAVPGWWNRIRLRWLAGKKLFHP